jgi:pyruvate dehydrogenase E1 component alpha subunit
MEETMIELSEELLLRMYYNMNQARFFDEKLEELAARGRIHGSVFPAIGQEASGVMPCLALEEGDLITMSHRSHAQAIGFGMDINLMMAECMGKVNGYCGGKGGSQHLADVENGNLGANGIVGGGFTLACGAALTQKYQKKGNVVLCFAGDGATNCGSFHEALNLASVWKLPIVFLIENNQYSMGTAIDKQMNIASISTRSESYNIPGLSIDGNDFLDVYNTVTKAIRYARADRGPVLIEARTYRLCGHSQGDKQAYRNPQEVEKWKENDPIARMETYLTDNRVFTEKQIQKLKDEARASVEKAFEFAMKSPEPELNTVLEDVYA